MKRIEAEIYNLCDEIDQWKAEAKYWEKQYEEVRKERIASINQSIDNSKKITGIIFNAILDPESSINKCHCKQEFITENR